MDKDTKQLIVQLGSILLIAVGAIILFYLYARLTSAGEVVEGDATSASRIRVWEDDERGVTCYIYDGLQNDSMFCVPNKELIND